MNTTERDAPTIIALPEGFPFPTNMGLHGDAQFFETGHHQFTYEGLNIIDDRATFSYYCWDSDEGAVFITYISTGGAPAVAGHVDGFDVEVRTGSDVWGLEDTASAISEAIALHRALGHNKGFDRDIWGK